MYGCKILALSALVSYKVVSYTRFFSYKKLSERVRAKSFLNFWAFKGLLYSLRVCKQFVNPQWGKSNYDLEF